MAKVYEVATQKELNVLYQECLALVKRGKSLKIEAKSVATKTNAQLGYYWDVVLPRIQERMKEDGNLLSLAEINQLMNQRFFSNTKTISWHKDSIEYVMQMSVPRSKSGASKDEFGWFLNCVIRWANTDLGVEIPEANRYISESPF